MKPHEVNRSAAPAAWVFLAALLVVGVALASCIMSVVVHL